MFRGIYNLFILLDYVYEIYYPLTVLLPLIFRSIHVTSESQRANLGHMMTECMLGVAGFNLLSMGYCVYLCHTPKFGVHDLPLAKLMHMQEGLEVQR